MADDQAKKQKNLSAKKLKDAREKGQVARSRDLASPSRRWRSTLRAGAARAAMMVAHGVARLTVGLSHARRSRRCATVSAGELGTIVIADGGAAGAASSARSLLASPPSSACWQRGAGAAWYSRPKPLTLDFTRLSPANGLAAAEAVAVGHRPRQDDRSRDRDRACWRWRIVHASSSTDSAAPDRGWRRSTPASAGWDAAAALLWQRGLALLALGGADYGLQRWRLDRR